MDKKLGMSVFYMFLGTTSFTILLLFLRDKYPTVFFGMMSGGQIPFQLSEAPIWIWVAFIAAIFFVVKGAKGIGRNLRKRE